MGRGYQVCRHSGPLKTQAAVASVGSIVCRAKFARRDERDVSLRISCVFRLSKMQGNRCEMSALAPGGLYLLRHACRRRE